MKWPVVPTIVVALAIAAMVALGFWQLDRRREKAVLLATYAANQHRPPVALPPQPDDALLFRPVTLTCSTPAPLPREAGRAADGSSGWRAIYHCAGGPLVQMGVAAAAAGRVPWPGGAVAGYLTHAPQHRALIAGAFDHRPPAQMVMAAAPLPGLKPNPAGNLGDVPNNHLAYAVQWFLFAAVAAIVYLLALRRRTVAPPRPRG